MFIIQKNDFIQDHKMFLKAMKNIFTTESYETLLHTPQTQRRDFELTHDTLSLGSVACSIQADRMAHLCQQEKAEEEIFGWYQGSAMKIAEENPKPEEPKFLLSDILPEETDLEALHEQARKSPLRRKPALKRTRSLRMKCSAKMFIKCPTFPPKTVEKAVGNIRSSLKRTFSSPV